MKLLTYYVTSDLQTDCDYCGCPLYTGDTAVDVDDGSAAACSKHCADKLQKAAA